MLALDIDPTKYLPSDDSTRGFDNIAGALALSPALLEGYTTAAAKISRIAMGDVSEPALATYRVASDTTQDYHIEGLPFGTRGGLVVQHEFPADGDYVFKVFPINKGLMDNNTAFGEITGEKLELLIDGAAHSSLRLGQGRRARQGGARRHGGSAFPGKGRSAYRGCDVPGHTACAQPGSGRAFPAKHHRNRRAAGLQVLSARRQDGDSGPVQAGRAPAIRPARRRFLFAVLPTRPRKRPARRRSSTRWRGTRSAVR